MAFKQGKRPAVVVPEALVRKFRGTLLSAGYKPHTGPRVKRNGETQAWVAPIGRGRQIHVQEAKRRDGNTAVYAHTEPAGVSVEHLAAALTDRVSFSGGSRALKSDLRRRGWRV